VASEDLSGLSVQLFRVNRLADKLRVFLQHPGHDVCPASFWLAQAPAKVFLLICFIGTKVIVGRLGGLGQPLPWIIRWTVVPALRQVGGAKLLRLNGEGGEKLIIEFYQLLWLCLTQVGDVQG